MKIYSLFDRKMREFGGLQLAANDDVVRRALSEGVRGTGSTPEKYPDDFDLMCLGDMDPASGKIVLEEPVRLVDNLSQLLPPPQRNGG